MKTWVKPLACFIFLCRTANGQGFIDLNFEHPTIVTSTPSGGGYNFGTANVPGWTEYNGLGDVNYSGGMTVNYNNPTLDDSGVTLVDTNFLAPIQGKYSIMLYGGSVYAENGTNGASIGQTAQIPTTAQSIIYWGNALQVTFNGQPLSFSDISDTPNYSIWDADISPYAGQTGQLLFTAPWQTYGLLDNIQFSTMAVPEPRAMSLFICGLLFFCCWKLWKCAGHLLTLLSPLDSQLFDF